MRVFVIASLVLVFSVAARDASAQGFISPFVGTTLTSPSTSGSQSRPGFGIALGTLGNVVGLDAEVAYFPEVLDKAANSLSKSRALTFSVDTLIGPHIGPVKAYGALGAGSMNLNFTGLSSLVNPTPDSLSTNYFTVNVGGGVIGFLTTHLGVRGDLRYFRAYGVDIADLEGAGLKLNHFDFWRASGGLVLTF